MVEFSGRLQDEAISCLIKFDRKRNIILVITLIISMIILAFSVSMLTIKQPPFLFGIYLILTILSGTITLYGLIVCLLYANTLRGLPFYKPCYFDNQKTIIDEWSFEVQPIYNPPIERQCQVDIDAININIDSIKKVFIEETFYIIVAGKFYKKAFVCQKNSITKGTLRDFEKIFEDKLVHL